MVPIDSNSYCTMYMLASHGMDGVGNDISNPNPRYCHCTIRNSIHSTMAATPEELLGLAEPAPLSPSVFLDLPPTTHGDSQQPQNDLALEYISRMLTEEDIVDKFFYQYPDHPELLQAEQPFAEILADTSYDAHESFASSTSILMASQGNNTDFMVSGCQVQDPVFFLNGTGTVEPNSMVFPSESSTRTDMLSSMAFFKGMEEANSFLPTVNVMGDARGRKKRSGMDGETEACMGRSSKQQ